MILLLVTAKWGLVRRALSRFEPWRFLPRQNWALPASTGRCRPFGKVLKKAVPLALSPNSRASLLFPQFSTAACISTTLTGNQLPLLICPYTAHRQSSDINYYSRILLVTVSSLLIACFPCLCVRRSSGSSCPIFA